MNWHTIHRLLPTRSLRYRIVVYTLAALVGIGQLLQGASPAVAAATPASTPGVERTVADNDLIVGPIDPSLLFSGAPPPLLNVYGTTYSVGQDGGMVDFELDRGGIFSATDAQEASLLDLEDAAVKKVIALHGLTDADATAVRSWGRDEALAQLFLDLMAAINEDETDRTDDEQNAVDWLTEVAHRKAMLAAEAAGSEYVKWAGLSESAYWDHLENIILTQSTLESFLDDSPQPYAAAATVGYCAFRAPAPYGSEYTGYNDPTCFAPCPSLLGCNPPTPSYDSFVKWGQAYTSYSWLNSDDFSRAAKNVGTAVGIGAAVATAAVSGTILAAAVVPTTITASYISAAIAQWTAWGFSMVSNAVFPIATTATIAGAVVGVVGIVIVALTIAVVQGIAVVNATTLPGQLADLIIDARTTTPDLKDMIDDTNGSTSLFAMFLGASLPTPIQQSCDNSALVRSPGITVIRGLLIELGLKPCLNPTPIPGGTPNDHKFLVKENGEGAGTLSPTISYKDPDSGNAATARLSGNWFITNANGFTSQDLMITYTNWEGESQNGWLLGGSEGGFVFIGIDAGSSAVDFSDCLDDGTCTETKALKFKGSDGKKYTAEVKDPSTATGAPKVTSTPIEGRPTSFDANDFKPVDAVDPLSYVWRFEDESCHISWFPCLTGNLIAFPFGESVAGKTVSHQFELGGDFQAELTATDATGASVTTRFVVTVKNESPSMFPLESNAGAGPVKVDQDVTVRTDFGDVGAMSRLQVSIDWGDGTSDAACISLEVGACQPFVPAGAIQLAWNDRSQLGFQLNSAHRYAVGTYTMRVKVWDQDGSAVSKSMKVVVERYAQNITFLGHSDVTYGDGPTMVSAMALTSNADLTFSASDPTVCSISRQYLHPFTLDPAADVSILGAGECEITASQPGSSLFDAGESTQTFTINPAALTVAGPVASMTYGGSVPAIQPTYAGFVNGDDPSDLDTAPTCTAPTGAGAGTYETTCVGGADNNYAMTYVAGTLTIEKAASPLAMSVMGLTTVKGQPIQIRAAIVQTVGAPSTHAGTVAFMEGEAAVPGCEAVPLHPTNLVATCGTTALSVGSHSIWAAYSGDANHVASRSPGAIGWTVGKAATSTGVTSAGPSVRGNQATFTASVGVVAPGAGTPTGTVSFFDGATKLGTGNLAVVDGKVVATFGTNGLALGKHSITAKYAGDGSFTASDSAATVHYVNTDLSRYPKLASGAWNLAGVNLKNAFLVGTALAGTDLTGANIGNATLIGANLEGAKLDRVTATGANFAAAEMASLVINGGNYKGAKFTATNLTGTTFSGVNLRGAKDLATATLNGVTWTNTVCPDGAQSAKNGDSCLGHLLP